jgi:hypothetical protein
LVTLSGLFLGLVSLLIAVSRLLFCLRRRLVAPGVFFFRLICRLVGLRSYLLI